MSKELLLTPVFSVLCCRALMSYYNTSMNNVAIKYFSTIDLFVGAFVTQMEFKLHLETLYSIMCCNLIVSLF